VDRIRSRGVEAVFESREFLARRLSVSANATYVNARTLHLSGLASATAVAGAADGKRLPNVPEWRLGASLVYRPSERWVLSASGRYSDMQYTTLDNTDVHPNRFQGYGAWFVGDLRAAYHLPGGRWTASVGVDNVLNRKYFLFNPFPQRSFTAEVRMRF
jgi:iron complex outermembrane receptor protein